MSALISTKQLKDQSFQLMKGAWKDTKQWLIVFLVAYVINTLLMDGLKGGFGRNGMMLLVGFLVFFCISLIQAFTGVALMRALLKHVFPQATLRGLNSSFGVVCVSGLLKGLMVMIGFIFLIIPGIWLSLSYQFAELEIIKNNKGPWSALQASFVLVKGRWWDVFWRLLIGSLWVIVAFIVWGILYGILAFVSSVLGPVEPTIDFILSLAHGFVAIAVLYFGAAWYVLLFRSLEETRSAGLNTSVNSGTVAG